MRKPLTPKRYRADFGLERQRGQTNYSVLKKELDTKWFKPQHWMTAYLYEEQEKKKQFCNPTKCK